ncbi:MAG: MBL fold metallo-hydrolase [Clostridia bacterium]|nr:MBL fold metallo-hydrolase [Clostridia bacterium]
MAGKHDCRIVAVLRRVLVVILVLLLIGSALITANDAAGLNLLPTWRELFAIVGLADEPLSPDALRVTFFDVGNADCTLIQSGGKAVLIDAGEHKTANDVVEQLRLSGVESLDYVIATHADADHIGGMEALIRELEIGTFLMPSVSETEEAHTQVYNSMITALERKGIPVADACYGFDCSLGDARLEILSGRHAHGDENERSVICRLRFGAHTFLLMGDAGIETENTLILDGADIRADVLKVGHHGSNTSTGSRFIRVVEPQYAVITCGVDNSMGHPHKDTLKTLKEHGVTVYRSDHHGNIVFTSDGTNLSVTTQR